MMGIFQVLLMVLRIIGTRFEDAGLNDILIQNIVVAGGSTEGVVREKQCNCVVRSYKLLWKFL